MAIFVMQEGENGERNYLYYANFTWKRV